ncbi:hypothetical protein OIU85_002077 [Salix viminalis]|uniref:Uncharacterized protein n=1 Tax=Salix viminalis TaxID=40686 RepID=A0A9Q0VMM1_SALVM|nr:hypothetical protein OIU85_002077 [Salix viminalis]
MNSVAAILKSFRVDLLLEHLQPTACHTVLSVGSLTSRVAVRHLIGHVDAVGALWKMICNVSNASQHVILQLMFSATHVPFARKVVRSA